MLYRLKQWLKEIFSEDEEVQSMQPPKNRSIQQDSKSQSFGSQSVHTKMSFQYPNQDSYPFPIMKDYERPKAPKPSREPKTMERDEPKSTYKVETTMEEKKSFRPTEVPSPIYGFQQRKPEEDEHSINDIPTYLRKRNTTLKTEQTSEQTSSPEPRITRQKGENKNSEEDYHEKVIPFQTRAKKEILQEEPIHQKGKKIQEEPVQEHKSEETKQETKQEFQFTSKPRTDKPYNVMMTPGDKRRLNQNKPKTKPDNPTYPPLHLLNDIANEATTNEEWLVGQQRKLETTLDQFNVKAKVTDVKRGPSVTRFEVQPDIGVKVNKFTNLTDDIKLNLAAADIRMEAPIPGKSAIGIEVPNPHPTMVSMQEILKNESFRNHSSSLAVGLGLDIEGETVVTDLKKMPHGLIAGATGSGKSVCINTILVSLLYRASYKDVKFLLIDPKVVELAPYNQIPHLVSPVITDVKAATASLKWAVEEMENRYSIFAREGVRDIDRFNEKIKQANRHEEKMPYIIIVIDELADLMMAAPQDVEDAISRIAQKARACGIHLLIATQRPSVDVITGLIKANVPTRIAFSVSSQVDSRTIIDMNGADKLLGKGDMLFLGNGAQKTRRIQGAFVSDEEVERVTNYVKKLAPPQYLFEQEDLIQQASIEEYEDELLQDAIELVVEDGRASTSLLQRKFSIGYNRAARMIDRLEEIGLISGQNGSKPREVLLSRDQVHEMLQLGDK
ncbi:DNA translocase FtsK [Salinibacillus xinjiangensis]|uniref:DNA translocase FtsK n=1 Tax=Salinibacillus xinjiangensis TaxID=1229268 RepID=A0A6G1X9S9_9BACI|nr:DNA translocase FtsK [Salinibacillus xinjiangensis]MRG87734.1 DNA translocase FtsK [Salinibacillus xinjiangensis]